MTIKYYSNNCIKLIVWILYFWSFTNFMLNKSCSIKTIISLEWTILCSNTIKIKHFIPLLLYFPPCTLSGLWLAWLWHNECNCSAVNSSGSPFSNCKAVTGTFSTSTSNPPPITFIKNVHLTHGKGSSRAAASSIASPFFGNAHKYLECALNSFLCCDKVHLLMTKSNNGPAKTQWEEWGCELVLAASIVEAGNGAGTRPATFSPRKGAIPSAK